MSAATREQPGGGARRSRLGRAVLAIAIAAAACSDDSTDDGGAPAAGSGASAAGQGGGGGAGGGGSGAGEPEDAAGSSGAPGGSSGTSGGNDAGLSDAGEARAGVCGQRGRGTVDASSFSGYQEFYLIGDDGFGDDLCVVRFELTRVGEAPEGCDDPTAGVDCLWTHLVELGNPSVEVDQDGACGSSELGLDAGAIAELDGTRVAYGFVSEFAGHNSVIMKYDDGLAEWNAYGNGTWDEATSAFRFDRRDGICEY